MSGSEAAIMANRDSYGVGLQKNPVHSQQSTGTPNMRLAFSSDGTAVYKPIITSASPPSYQQQQPPTIASPAGTGASVGAGGGGATAAAVEISSAIVPHSGLSMNMGSGEPMKRKRGRPRKYGPDGTMALALTPVSASVHSGGGGGGGSGGGGGGGFSPSSGGLSPTSKKARGRPPGSGKKQQMAALGSAGIGFTPHVITVKTGEDVASKIMAFSHNSPRAVCILSANGAISNVTLRQAATSGGTVTYEGRFEILSLSGSFLYSESGGQRSRTGGLSVSLAGPDGRVLGGGVAGLLTAASPVQVVVGSFIAADGRKEMKANHSEPSAAPTKPTPNVGLVGTSSPPSRGTMSESSGGPGSPMNLSTGACNNNNNAQGIPNMPWK